MGLQLASMCPSNTHLYLLCKSQIDAVEPATVQLNKVQLINGLALVFDRISNEQLPVDLPCCAGFEMCGGQCHHLPIRHCRHCCGWTA